MEHRRLVCSAISVPLYLLLLLLLLSSSPRSFVDAYTNYTVGESSGWFDNLEKSDVDYQKWADSKSFSLGDFLVFNTDNNHSVVQTYNFTTYKLCDSNDALDNDTTEWSAANPSATSPTPVSVAVPLVKEGMNYFFSGNYDGEQCKFGQRFKINVKYGKGLPPSLKPPSSSDQNQTAPGPDGFPQSGDDESAPDTIVPANFDHPKEIQDDDETDDKKKNSGFSQKFSDQWSNWVVLIFTGLFVF